MFCFCDLDKVNYSDKEIVNRENKENILGKKPSIDIDTGPSKIIIKEKDGNKKEKKINGKGTGEMKDEKINVRNILLLGAGHSGKSTIFKQMRNIYGNGYTEKQRLELKEAIHQNILSNIKILIKNLPLIGIMDEYSSLSLSLDEENIRVNKIIYNYIEKINLLHELNCLLDINTLEIIQKLWNSREIKEVYKHKSRFSLDDSCEYFMNKIDIISKEDYIPTEEDILHIRIRTTGIVESSYVIQGIKFNFIDVGGQRNERKKWIHCFDGVDAILFVAAISEYDQYLYEDDSVNCLEEALNLFEEISCNRWLSHINIILFLNKVDLFKEKIERIPLSLYFPDYKGEDSILSGTKFMENLFRKRYRGKEKLYIHTTCATNRDNVKLVFEGVKDMIIRKSLKEFGLM